eukprot:1355190-Pyramimonas_sp.AAC.1
MAVPAQPTKNRNASGTNSKASPQSAPRSHLAKPTADSPVQSTTPATETSRRRWSLRSPASAGATTLTSVTNSGDEATTSMMEPDACVGHPTGLRTMDPKWQA